jgi:hypothetical protein
MRRVVPALAAALVLAPEVAWACTVCTGGNSEATGRAFLLGSLFLSLLPLAAVAVAAWWLRRRARALGDPVDRRASPPALGASTPR